MVEPSGGGSGRRRRRGACARRRLACYRRAPSAASTARKNAATPRRVLDAGRGLGAAGGVDRVRVGPRDPLAHVVGRQPAREHQRHAPACAPGQLPVEALPGAPARWPGTWVSSRWKSIAEGAQGSTEAASLTPRGLHHRAARAPRRLAAVDRALVAVELEDRERAAVGERRATSSSVRVDEHAGDLDPALERRGRSPPRLDRVQARGLCRPEDQARSPRRRAPPPPGARPRGG